MQRGLLGKIIFLISVLVRMATQVNAQGKVEIRFDSIPVGTELTEQFASLGVHFVGEGRYSFPLVIASPISQNPSVSHIAYFANNTGRNVGMRFDYPLASVSMDVAVGSPGVPGKPGWYLGALDHQPPTTVITQNATDLAGFDTWKRVTLDIPRGSDSRLLEIQGFTIYDNLNYGGTYFFSNIDIVFVPEPQILILGGMVFLILVFPVRSSRSAAWHHGHTVNGLSSGRTQNGLRVGEFGFS